MKTVLITGGTGVLGSALVPRYLNEEGSRVYLLLRAADEHALAGRVRSLFDYWADDIRSPTARDRLIAVRGDVGEPGLGLSRTLYENLTHQLTHIVHSAASVKMNMTEAEAYRASVRPTQEILALADLASREGRFQKLDYVSTVGVAGRMPGIVPETPIRQPRAFHNTYESSKAEAEELVLTAIGSGLAATIHRPSMVVGDSRSGKVVRTQAFHFLARFLSGANTYGFLPRASEVRLDIVPSDYVAKAIHWSSGASQATGRIVHLCSGPQAVPILELMDVMRAREAAAGRRLPPKRLISTTLFRGALAAAGMVSAPATRKRLANLRLFLDYAEDRQLFDNSRSVELLREGGIELPDPLAYLPAVLAYRSS